MPDENLDTTPPVTGKTTATGNNKMLYILGGSVLGLAAIGGLVFFLMQQNAPPPADDSNTAAATTGAAGSTGLVEDGAGTTTPKVNPVAPGVPKPPVATIAGKPSNGMASALTLPTKDSWTRLAEKMQMKDKIATSAPAPAPSGDTTGMGSAPSGVGGAGGAGGATTKPLKDIKMAMASANGRRPDPFVSFYKVVTQRTPATQFAISDRLASPMKPPPIPKDDRPIEDILGPLPIVERRVAGILYNGGISAILEIGTFPASETYVVRPGDKVVSGVSDIGDMTVESINLTELLLRAPDGRTAKVKISGLRPDQISAILSQMGNGSAGTGGMSGGPGMGGMPAGPGAGGGAGKGGGFGAGAPSD
jgi:hypothetical protein